MLINNFKGKHLQFIKYIQIYKKYIKCPCTETVLRLCIAFIINPHGGNKAVIVHAVNIEEDIHYS